MLARDTVDQIYSQHGALYLSYRGCAKDKDDGMASLVHKKETRVFVEW